MKEFNDKQRRDLCLNHSHKKDLVSVNAQEVVVRSGDNRRHIFCLSGPLLGLKEVITNRTADYTFPVFLQENISRGVDQEKTMNHGEACWWERNTFTVHKSLDLANFQSWKKKKEAPFSFTELTTFLFSIGPRLTFFQDQTQVLLSQAHLTFRHCNTILSPTKRILKNHTNELQIKIGKMSLTM